MNHGAVTPCICAISSARTVHRNRVGTGRVDCGLPTDPLADSTLDPRMVRGESTSVGELA